jgi:hypothetical protein
MATNIFDEDVDQYPDSARALPRHGIGGHCDPGRPGARPVCRSSGASAARAVRKAACARGREPKRSGLLLIDLATTAEQGVTGVEGSAR